MAKVDNSGSSTSPTNLFLMTSLSSTSSMYSITTKTIASPLSQYHPCPSKCPHYTIFTNSRMIIMTRQLQRLLGHDHLDIMDDKEYLSRLEGEKKTESVLVRGQPPRILSTPGPTPGLLRTVRENDFCDIQVICFHL